MIKNPFIENILSRSSIGIKDFFLKRNDILNKNIIFFKNGRDAIIYGIKKLKIQDGSNILIPSYICKSIPDVLELNGYKIVYQDINDQLSLDINTLKNNIIKHQIKAVLFVNYFGFIRNNSAVLDLCRDLNIVSLEDNCHSYLSGDRFYSEEIEADLSIFSLRKTIPIKNGGALKFNSKHSKKFENISIKKYKIIDYLKDIFFIFSKIIEMTIARFGLFNLYSSAISKIKYKVVGRKRIKQTSEAPRKIFPETPSPFLLNYISNHKFKSKLINKIQINFYEMFSGMKKLGYVSTIKEYENNSLPQHAVFFDNNERLFSYLRRKRIGATMWPAHDLPSTVKDNIAKYPKTDMFNNKLIMLPIHYQINSKHRLKILDIIKKLELKNNI